MTDVPSTSENGSKQATPYRRNAICSWTIIFSNYRLEVVASWREILRKERDRRKEGEMASQRKIEANRLNATRSTGPKTETGKARSSHNARQHGLSRLNLADDVSSDAVASAITAGLVPQENGSTVADLVRANLWLSQIREVRHGMLAALLGCPSSKQIKRLAGLERYERTVRAKQRRVLKGRPKEE